MGGQAAQVMVESDRLKPGWQWVKFGDVVRLSQARCSDPKNKGIERYVGLEHIDPDDLKIRRWGLVEEGTTFTSLFKPGQVLFGKRRAYLRKVAVADFEGICSGDIYVFESADTKVLLPELLPFICHTDRFFEYAIATSAGSLSPRTNWKSLVNFEFALPPLEEQKNIFLLLSSVEHLVGSYLQANIDAQKNRNALSLFLFSEDGKTRTSKLKYLIEDSRYGPRFSSSLYDKSGAIAQIRTTDLDENGNIDYTAVPRVKLSLEDYKDHLLRDRDIVISRSGTCGITAIFHYQTVPTIPGAFLIRLRTNDRILPEYLHEFFSSLVGRRLTTSLARGGVQKNISGSQLLAQEVPCPDISRQKDVVATLKALRFAEAQISNRLATLQKIKSLSLNSALGGVA